MGGRERVDTGGDWLVGEEGPVGEVGRGGEVSLADMDENDNGEGCRGTGKTGGAADKLVPDISAPTAIQRV